MSFDHPQEVVGTPLQRALIRIKDLEGRVRALEQGVNAGPGEPVVPGNSVGRNGDIEVRRTAAARGLLVKIDGAWYEAPLTTPR